jgi:hypothetical protein
VLKIGGFTFVICEGELDLWVLSGLRIDFAGALREIKPLALGGKELAAQDCEGDDEVFHEVELLGGKFLTGNERMDQPTHAEHFNPNSEIKKASFCG